MRLQKSVFFFCSEPGCCDCRRLLCTGASNASVHIYHLLLVICSYKKNFHHTLPMSCRHIVWAPACSSSSTIRHKELSDCARVDAATGGQNIVTMVNDSFVHTPRALHRTWPLPEVDSTSISDATGSDDARCTTLSNTWCTRGLCLEPMGLVCVTWFRE